MKVGCVWEAEGRCGRQGKYHKSRRRSGLCQAELDTGRLAKETGSFLEITLRCGSWWGKTTSLLLQSKSCGKGGSFRGAPPAQRFLSLLSTAFACRPGKCLAGMCSSLASSPGRSPGSSHQNASRKSSLLPSMPMHAPRHCSGRLGALHGGWTLHGTVGLGAATGACQLRNSTCWASVAAVGKEGWTQEQRVCFPRRLSGT